MRKLPVFFFALLLLSCSQLETQKPQPAPRIYDERAEKLIKIKDSVAEFFSPMTVHEGDWLKSFPENGQTFEEYLSGNPTLPTTQRQIIYVQPIGDFTETQRKILELTAVYMKAFYNLPVKLNAEKRLKNVPKKMSRTNPFDGQKQIRSGYFLEDLLPKMLPDDAAAFICFTNFDLFPDENWNYVFGQANLETRVGVWSLWRFGDPDKSVEDFRKFLARTLKVAMHETGHMFSIHHCTKYICLMSGSNHLEETDRQPLDVCPECMAKIAWAMKYDPVERYQNLAAFWENQGWMKDKASFLGKAEAVRKASE
jgi:archaemetzincin